MASSYSQAVGHSALIDWETVGEKNRRSTPGQQSGSNGGQHWNPTPNPKRQRQASSFDGGVEVSEASDTNISERINIMPLNEFQTMNMDEKLDTMFTLIQSTALDHTKFMQLHSRVGDTEHELRRTVDRVRVLEYKQIDIEARSRRNNLLIRSLPEAVNEDPGQVVCDFLANKMGIDTRSIAIQRAHRVGRRQSNIPGSGGRGFRPAHRPMIVGFRDYPDVELVLSKTKLLAGTSFGISRDFPQEIAKARNELYPRMKKLRTD
ncbi:MAG: hypothetical protein ABW185_03845 [Sedimenticola sp.]